VCSSFEFGPSFRWKLLNDIFAGACFSPEGVWPWLGDFGTFVGAVIHLYLLIWYFYIFMSACEFKGDLENV
jgi:hypothetical protein